MKTEAPDWRKTHHDRGQAQIVCNLYVENVPEGGMDITRHRDLLNNTLHILSSFNLLWGGAITRHS